MSKLNLISPICYTGYGVAGNNITKALYKLGVKLALWPIGEASCDSRDKDIFQEVINNTHEYNIFADCIRIWHQFDLAQFVGKGQHIGFPIFELDNFNVVEKHHMANCDRLFVCSQWAKDVINKYLPGITIDVIPLGVDNTIFYPAEKHSVALPPRQESAPYIFFNAGKWEKRKGHDILIEAFNKAFEPDDNVELWMMPFNPFLNAQETNEWHRLYLNSKLGEKIFFMDRCNSHDEVAGIMRQVDCGVFPSRAEGWNLELLEIMACGKPVITTNYSAHTEFCSAQNSSLIDIAETESAFDGKWFHNQGNWATIGETQIDQLVEYMRQMYKNKIYKNEEGLKTAKDFTWKNSAEKILSALTN